MKRPGLIFLLVLVILLMSLFQSLSLLKKSHDLLTVSQTFPTDFFVGNPSDPEFRYLALGDSTAQGLGVSRVEETVPYLIATELAKQNKYIHVLNLGISGSRMQQVIDLQLANLESFQPDVVTLQCGANDATHFTSLQNFEQSLTTIITKLSNPDFQTYVTSTPDLSLPAALFFPLNQLINQRAIKQNQIFRKLLSGTKIQEINLFDQAKLDPQQNPHFHAADKFHPATEGYEVWAKLFVKNLN